MVGGWRDEVTLGTKFGFRIENGKQVGTDRDSRPEHISRVVEDSLRQTLPIVARRPLHGTAWG